MRIFQGLRELAEETMGSVAVGAGKDSSRNRLPQWGSAHSS